MSDQIYLLNDVSRDDREMASQLFSTRKKAEYEFKLRVENHMDIYGLTEDDFNSPDEDPYMELTDTSMWDWMHNIEIYFIPLSLY